MSVYWKIEILNISILYWIQKLRCKAFRNEWNITASLSSKRKRKKRQKEKEREHLYHLFCTVVYNQLRVISTAFSHQSVANLVINRFYTWYCFEFFFFFTFNTTSFHFAILASSRNGWTGGAIGSAERGFWITQHHTPRFRDGNVSAPHTPRIPRALSRWEGFAWRSMSYSERIERVEGYELGEGTHFLPVATYLDIFKIYSFTEVISRLCCGLIDYSTS